VTWLICDTASSFICVTWTFDIIFHVAGESCHINLWVFSNQFGWVIRMNFILCEMTHPRHGYLYKMTHPCEFSHLPVAMSRMSLSHKWNWIERTRPNLCEMSHKFMWNDSSMWTDSSTCDTTYLQACMYASQAYGAVVCCSVLQCVAVRCSVLQCRCASEAYCDVVCLVCCSVLQCATVCQHVAWLVSAVYSRVSKA